eukprot:26783-Chlamydomonas_euryale.AAC.2
MHQVETSAPGSDLNFKAVLRHSRNAVHIFGCGKWERSVSTLSYMGVEGRSTRCSQPPFRANKFKTKMKTIQHVQGSRSGVQGRLAAQHSICPPFGPHLCAHTCPHTGQQHADRRHQAPHVVRTQIASADSAIPTHTPCPRRFTPPRPHLYTERKSADGTRHHTLSACSL